MFVGGLLAAAWIEYRVTLIDELDDLFEPATKKLAVAIVLTVVEVLCFVWFRFGG